MRRARRACPLTPGCAAPSCGCSRRRCLAASRRTSDPSRRMDNVCHTLVGAALGEAGLKRGTRLGLVTLMIASNLPDLDVLVFLTSTPSVAFRRGWTHGVLAQAV